jgi:O-antigen/teichoic acid export membrane protein
VCPPRAIFGLLIMGIVFRQGAINTAILFAGILIGFVNEFILLRNMLQEEQVGLIKLLLSVTAVFAQFGALGGINTLLRYFPYFRNKEAHHGGALFGFLAIGGLGFGLVALFLWLFRAAVEARFAENSLLFTQYYALLYPLILFSLNFLLLEAYAKSNYRTVASAFLQEIVLRLLITLSVGLYALGWISIHEFYLAFTAANCLVTVFLAAWIIRTGDWLIKPVAGFFRGPLFRQMLGFGFITLLSNFSARLYTSIDSIMIGQQIGLSAVAIYMTGSYLSSVIMAPGRSLIRIASPLVADHWKNNNMAAMNKLYRQVAVNSFVVSSWVFLVLYASTGALFSLIPPSFAPAIPVFVALGIARIYDMATGINGTILATSSKYYFVAAGNLLTAAVAIGTNLWLIPRYGIQGAGLATLITILSTNTLRVLFVYRAFGLFPFSRSILGALFAALLAWGSLEGAMRLSGGTGNVWADAILGTMLVSGCFLGIILPLRVSEDLHERLLKVWKRFGPRG